MNFKSPLLTLLFIITFFSCSSDDSSNNNTSGNDESSNNDELPQESDLLLRQRITDFGDGDIFTETFSYDENNNLLSILGSEGYEYEYIYENNLLMRINNNEPNGDLISDTTLEYNSDN